MKFWKSLFSVLTVEFTSAVPEQILDEITHAKIPLSNVAKQSELTYRFQIPRRDSEKLFTILQRRGCRMEILQKSGLYWNLMRCFHRPILLGTCLLLLISALYLPSRIFFVSVEGNTTIPDRLILNAAEQCGIRFAASRKLVRSEKIKNALLAAVPQLQWAGINTSGCTAVISVRERAQEETHEKTNLVSNLIADRDGYILSSTITSGTALISPGETVTKGQVLVSGYTDCGICIRVSRAEGEIIAQTNHEIRAVMPQTCMISEPVSGTAHKISLLIGKKRINLWKDSRISGTGCGRMYEEYFVCLPGGFRLPAAICIDRYLPYEIQKADIPQVDAQLQLQRFAEEYLQKQMVAGQIIRKKYTLSCTDRLYQIVGSYACREIIGKEQTEQIGDINGKRS